MGYSIYPALVEATCFSQHAGKPHPSSTGDLRTGFLLPTEAFIRGGCRDDFMHQPKQIHSPYFKNSAKRSLTTQRHFHFRNMNHLRRASSQSYPQRGFHTRNSSDLTSQLGLIISSSHAFSQRFSLRPWHSRWHHLFPFLGHLFSSSAALSSCEEQVVRSMTCGTAIWIPS